MALDSLQLALSRISAYGDHCEIRKSLHCWLRAGLDSVKKVAQLPRLWSVGCRQRPEGDGCLGKHFHRKHQVLIKGCLELATYLLTARVCSIYVPNFQGIWEMECLSPRTACLLLHPIQLQCPIYYNRWHETKQMAGRDDLRQKIDLAFG